MAAAAPMTQPRIVSAALSRHLRTPACQAVMLPRPVASVRTEAAASSDIAAAQVARTVMVASKNPAKARAVQGALRQCFPDTTFTVTNVEAASGVRDQPWGSDETLQGATNRVRHVIAQQPDCSLVVAIEGGVEWVSTGTSTTSASTTSTTDMAASGSTATPSDLQAELHCFAWVVVAGRPGSAISRARSGSFVLPPALATLVAQGMELGDADDQVFNRTKSGHGSGTIGKLTGNLMTRQAYYEHAVVLALVPYMSPDLYPQHIMGQCSGSESVEGSRI